MILVDFAKYFLHGFLYVAVFLIWPIGWYPLVLLLYFGVFGWVLTVAILIGVLGFSNSLIVRYLWSRTEFVFWRVVFQGVALLALLVLMDAIGLSGQVNGVILVALGSFIMGIVGRGAAQFQIKGREPVAKEEKVTKSKTGAAKRGKQKKAREEAAKRRGVD
jgi:hypothetical protein